MNDTEKNKNSNAITISRTLYDLTHLISQDTPIYPGDPQPADTPGTADRHPGGRRADHP